MPEVDFSTIDEAGDFTPLPEGKYVCRLESVDDNQTTQFGDEMWRMQFKVIKGEYKNRYIFDNMVFSEKAMPRVKLICSRMGLDVSGAVELTTDLLIGRAVVIEITTEDYTDEQEKTRKRNVVTFAGYQRAEEGAGEGEGESGAEGSEDGDESDMPF